MRFGKSSAKADPTSERDVLIISATKGLENETHQTISRVLREAVGPHCKAQIACLSGPSFAREVSRKFPTAVAVAGSNPQAAQIAQDLFTRPYFRVYTNPDLIGVELGGAIKNVMAIAAGTSDGLGFGHSSRAALITRGLAEMTRLGVSMGAEAQTFSGLAGLGDLVLTCTGDLSRNRQVGLELGKGSDPTRDPGRRCGWSPKGSGPPKPCGNWPGNRGWRCPSPRRFMRFSMRERIPAKRSMN